MRDIAYLKLLAREYPTIQSASTEIINLTAIQGLPKGTEYFFSDLHGEHEAFIHLLRSSSGIIREKIKETFGYVIPEDEQDELANLIYYPKRTLNQLAQSDSDHNNDDWKRITIYRLVQLCKQVSSKYTRSKVRKKLPPGEKYRKLERHRNHRRRKHPELSGDVVRSWQESNQWFLQLCSSSRDRKRRD